jgi:hypothetical protein
VTHRIQGRSRLGPGYPWRYECTGCGAGWKTRHPRSDCPRVPLFRALDLGRNGAWERAHATGFHSKTQWKKRGRVLLDDVEPTAFYESGNTAAGNARRVALYREDQTRPTRGEAVTPPGELFGGEHG